MDGRSFDRLTREFTAKPRGRRRVHRAALGGMLGGMLGRSAAASCVPPGDRCDDGDRCCDGTCRRNRCRCSAVQRTCGRRCVPIDHCCGDDECDANERCTGGACEPCLAQGASCTADTQCCTGICDLYTNQCQQVRVFCATDSQCPGGQCCNAFGDAYCLYEQATQRTCVPQTECSYLLCGDRCRELENGNYEYCGYYGPAACRNGRCCCPSGIPLAECQGAGPAIPRCD